MFILLQKFPLRLNANIVYRLRALVDGYLSSESRLGNIDHRWFPVAVFG